MILEFPNFVSEKQLQEIKGHINLHNNLITKNKLASYRDGKTLEISEEAKNNAGLKKLDSLLFSIFSKINDEAISRRYKPLSNYGQGDTGYEYHKYGPKEIAHPHGDGEITPDNLIRFASVVLHLNTIEDGGELVFPNQNVSVKTEAGKIVVFPPYNMFEHYTTPSSQEREIIVTWLIYNGVKVQFL